MFESGLEHYPFAKATSIAVTQTVTTDCREKKSDNTPVVSQITRGKSLLKWVESSTEDCEPELMDQVDSLCCEWLGDVTNELSFFPEPSVKQLCFQLAFVWFKKQSEEGPTWWKIKKRLFPNDYLNKFPQYFLEESSLDNLTHHEFVFCMFLAGLSHSLRGKDYRGVPDNMGSKIVRYTIQ